MSLPSWERGLKYSLPIPGLRDIRVAPLVGAWIEIPDGRLQRPELLVAPLVGAWIEIWARVRVLGPLTVAPLVGAWIEI